MHYKLSASLSSHSTLHAYETMNINININVIVLLIKLYYNIY